MDSTAAAGIIGAGAAVAGALVAGGVSLGVETRRTKADRLEAQRKELRDACSQFTAAVARIRSNSYDLHSDPGAADAIRVAVEEARVECERLRILIDHRETQKAARMALRHAYAVWKLAETGTDPRAIEFPGIAPQERLREQLSALYVGVRRELGLKNPEDVFQELDT